MHTFFVPTSDFQQIVAFILYTTVWLNLHHWSQSTASRTSWINRFKRFQVTRFTWPEFCKKKMLYVCLHVGIQTTQQLHFAGGYQYVGSTTQTIFQRRIARIRKLNQLHTDKLVKCELALRYWHSTKNFFEYVMMPWKAFPTDSQLHVQELLLIEKLQPKLNYPFISRLIFAAGKFPRASKVPPISSLPLHTYRVNTIHLCQSTTLHLNPWCSKSASFWWNKIQLTANPSQASYIQGPGRNLTYTGQQLP